MAPFAQNVAAPASATGVAPAIYARTSSWEHEPHAPARPHDLSVNHIAERLEAREYRLGNGLKVVTVPAGTAPVATVMVLYRVGSRDEATGYTGAAHLLEHMLFKGTPTNNAAGGRDFMAMLSELGGQNNATTWYDRTNYFETIPSEYIGFVLELEADRMHAAFIADVDRRSEMTVVRNEAEIKAGNMAQVLFTATAAAAFTEHPYRHPTIGWMSDVENVSTDRLRDIYHTYYRPDNATLFVVGQFDFERLREDIERTFGALEVPDRTLPEVYTTEPPQLGEKSVTIRAPGEAERISIAYHIPAALGQLHVLSRVQLAERARAPRSREPAALELLASVLADGISSRFYRRLVNSGLALSAGATAWKTRDPGLLYVDATVRPGQSSDAVRAGLEDEIETLAADGPTDEELQRAVRVKRSEFAFSRESCTSIASQLAESEARGSWRMYEDQLDLLSQLTAADVRDVARSYLRADNRTNGRLGPGSPVMFAMPPVPAHAATAGVARASAVRLPMPERIRVEPFASQIASGRMKQALAWAFVPNRTSRTFALRVRLDAGPAFAPGNSLLAHLTASLLTCGTTSENRFDIDRRLVGLGSSRSIWCDDRAGAFDATALRIEARGLAESFEALCDQLRDELEAPALATDELERIKLEMHGGLEAARSNTARSATQRFLAAVFSRGDVRRLGDIDELQADLAAVDIEQVRAFYENVIRSAARTVSASGGLDENLVARCVAGAFAPQASRETAHLLAHTDSGSGVEYVDLPRKETSHIVAGGRSALRPYGSHYLGATLANAIVGGHPIDARLGHRLRYVDGLTYGATSRFTAAGRAPGTWRVETSCAPHNVERALTGIREVLQSFADAGPTARELEAAANNTIGRSVLQMSEGAGVVQFLEAMQTFDLEHSYIDSLRERTQAVTVADVRAAAAATIPTDLQIAIAGSKV